MSRAAIAKIEAGATTDAQGRTVRKLAPILGVSAEELRPHGIVREESDVLVPTRRVVCAALRVGERVVCGPRHFDHVMRETIDAIKASGGPSFATAEQGFVDQWGEWLTRGEAWKVADDAGQIVRRVGCDGELYSENLY